MEVALLISSQLPSGIMRVSGTLYGLLPLTAIATAAEAEETCAALSRSCQKLAKQHSDDVFLPGHQVYEYETGPGEFWSNTQLMSPDCVFRPRSSDQLANAVSLLVDLPFDSQFAIRGGGHMPIRVGLEVSVALGNEARNGLFAENNLHRVPTMLTTVS